MFPSTVLFSNQPMPPPSAEIFLAYTMLISQIISCSLNAECQVVHKSRPLVVYVGLLIYIFIHTNFGYSAPGAQRLKADCWFDIQVL